MTLNGAIMQLVELHEHSMMPEFFKPALANVIDTISELEEPTQTNAEATQKCVGTTQDCVSRQEAIDAVGYYSLHNGDKLMFADKPLKELPSAQPQRMRGRWIPHKSKFGGEDEKVYTCDQCGHNIGFHAENFCPNCGADMRGEQDDEMGS